MFQEIAGCVYVVKDFDGLLDTVPSNSGITRYKTHATRNLVGATLPVVGGLRDDVHRERYNDLDSVERII